MTGIERLREFVAGVSPFIAVCGVTRATYDREHTEVFGARLRDFLAEIADQIAREQVEAAADHAIVASVASDMERHVLGHEGMEDSPVARWARELREALGCADEADEDREAVAWVREHGGLDYVMHEWQSQVPRDLYERRRQRLLDHIAKCETALGRRNRRIEELGKTIEFFQLNNSNFRHLLADVAERLGFTRYGDDYEPEDLLDALDRRLMPDGMGWPRYEDDGLVQTGSDAADVEGNALDEPVVSIEFFENGFTLHGDASQAFYGYEERVKRPAPEDSWERLEEDATKNPFDYCKDVGHRLDTCENSEAYKARDIVRRARALAERDA